MSLLDVFLSRFRWWRRRRGGVWEQWLLEGGGGPTWFGPMKRTSWECRVIINEAIERYRSEVRDGRLSVRTALEWSASALMHERPLPQCRGTPVVEDWR